MFALSLLFLAVLSAVVVLWVDIPMMNEPLGHRAGAASATPPDSAPVETLMEVEEALKAGRYCLSLLEVMWLVFLLEFAISFVLRDRELPFWRFHFGRFLVALCPPMRLCARNPDMGGRLWLPGLGWRKPNAALRTRLERMFSIPMIFIALAILPVLLIEFGMRRQVDAHPGLQLVLHVSVAIIWFAFAAEFIVMFAVAEKKLRYCREHWLDIAIILLPFISFLRSLRIVRATRVARLARVEQLVRMSRLYRLRGLAMRALRAMLLLKLINRLLRIAPEKQLERLREQLREKEADARHLRRQIMELESAIAAEQAGAPKSPDAHVSSSS
jgi:voltage-gated potassium channel